MTHHEPWIRVVKRPHIERRKAILFRVLALLGALLAGALLVALLGYDPIKMYSDMVSGAIGKTFIAVNKKGVLAFSTSSQATLKIMLAGAVRRISHSSITPTLSVVTITLSTSPIRS